MNECHLRIACRNAPVSSQCGTCSQWGGGTDRKKINLRQEQAVNEGGVAERQRAMERWRVQGSSAVWPRQGLRVPPLSPLFTHRNFGQFHSSPFSGHWKGQIPSWLLTLYPVRVVAIMGKSKPLASSVGYLSALRYSLSANSGPA